MMMDSRLNSSDRVILTALASHYNLKTGDCFPALGRLAIEVGLGEGETGTRAVRRTLSRAAELGWIERTSRRGGSPDKNQTNLYELTLPQSICDILASIEYRPPGLGRDAYRYLTSDDQPDKTPLATGQNGGTDRTNEGGRPDIRALQNREDRTGKVEHSVSKDTAAPASRSRLLEKEAVGERALRARELEATASDNPLERGLGYTENELDAVRDGVSNHGLDTVGAIVGYARETGYFLTENAVGNMIREGHLTRDGDRICLPADVET
jgi:hypothetical protein